MQPMIALFKEEAMKKIDINDIPVLEYDPGIPDTKWGETTTSSTTIIITAIIAILA